jgi:hypothetical protein
MPLVHTFVPYYSRTTLLLSYPVIPQKSEEQNHSGGVRRGKDAVFSQKKAVTMCALGVFPTAIFTSYHRAFYRHPAGGPLGGLHGDN